MKWNEYSTWKSNLKKIIRVLIILFIINGIYLAIFKTFQSWDSDPDRGAIVLEHSKFKDDYKTLYPNADSPEEVRDWQGWSPSDSMWFYTTTQGSDLMPYDFFMVLEKKDSQELIRSNENMDSYRYIVLKPTFSNPDGLPVGFVKDKYNGDEYVGFTCAACHTAQVNYKGVAMRVDGAPAMSDMETFIDDANSALLQTNSDEAKQKRFVKAVLDRNGFWEWLTGGRNYTSEEEVLEDLKKYASRLQVYATINKSEYKKGNKEYDLKYGYARLDAFGRIFNRTLQHVLNRDAIEKVLASVLPKDKLKTVLKGIKDDILTNDEFDHILDRIRPLLSNEELLQVSKEIFNSPNAPVSYPYMWDVPNHDYLQWNGIAANAGVGPLARNTGEVIGVFGTLDWQAKRKYTLNSILLGAKETKVSFRSSVDAHNLERLENHLNDLYSPLWPEDKLTKIDHKKAEKGEELFKEYCASCHHSINRTDPYRKVVASFINLKQSGTDTTMAMNALTRTGASGILKNKYISAFIGNMVTPEQAPVALLFLGVTKNVLLTPDYDRNFIRRWYGFVYNVAATFFRNKIKPSLRAGTYTPSTTVGPFNALAAYKSRPLNGIWATAPYLHNGSVPTLYDLLLPSKKDLTDKDGVFHPTAENLYRPDKFLVGSREFDPVKVGFITKGYDDVGFTFDTSLPGNYNTGHSYKMDELTDEERWQLVEYLKTL
ncbi:MAG: di-heme-cytochrome C peroxidase [Leptospirales bacterium]